MEFHKFPSIEGLHQVIKSVRIPWDVTSLPVSYKGKIKLHGTNAGVMIKHGIGFKAMKRTGFITPEDDNCGFAIWVESTKDYWNSLVHSDNFQGNYIVWGEWCGPGVQKGTALTEIPEKIFAVFMLESFDGYVLRMPEPLAIETFILYNAGKPPKEIYILPWMPEVEGQVDFCQRESLELYAAKVNQEVTKVDIEDPWIKQTFGISGPGEGYVLYPSADFENIWVNNLLQIEDWKTRFMFKAKGEKHQVVKNKAPVILDPEVIKGRIAFTDKFVTESRLNQGLTEVGGPDIKKMGDFLKWIGNDILNESETEREANGFDWKDLNKPISQIASTWFKKKCMEI